MTLNINNPEAHRLSRELAALTGESMTAAVTEAVRERLARIRRGRQAAGGCALACDRQGLRGSPDGAVAIDRPRRLALRRRRFAAALIAIRLRAVG
jgi:antitoxin VapB